MQALQASYLHNGSGCCLTPCTAAAAAAAIGLLRIWILLLLLLLRWLNEQPGVPI
jgi:hypothetical protein